MSADPSGDDLNALAQEFGSRAFRAPTAYFVTGGDTGLKRAG